MAREQRLAGQHVTPIRRTLLQALQEALIAEGIQDRRTVHLGDRTPQGVAPGLGGAQGGDQAFQLSAPAADGCET